MDDSLTTLVKFVRVRWTCPKCGYRNTSLDCDYTKRAGLVCMHRYLKFKGRPGAFPDTEETYCRHPVTMVEALLNPWT